MALPFILGGITLAAVGYGLNRYCKGKDDCTLELADDIGDALNSVEDSVFAGLDTLESYLDEEEKPTTPVTDIFSSMEEKRGELYEMCNRFQTLFKDMEKSTFEPMDFPALPVIESSVFTELHPEREQYLCSYGHFVTHYTMLLTYYHEKLTQVITVSKDYESYTEETKKILLEGYQVLCMGRELCHMRLLKDDGAIPDDAKALLSEALKLSMQLSGEVTDAK